MLSFISVGLTMVLIHKNENTKALNEKNTVHFEHYELGGQRRWFHITAAHDRWQSTFKDFGNHRREQIVNAPCASLPW